MLTAILTVLAITPVSLNLDLSKDTTARLGPRVRQLIEERLSEEGFPVDAGAKLKLGVEELHGVLHLWAKVGRHEAESELRPANEWPAELGFELAQRLAVLAHEAEALVPVTAKPPDETPPPEPLAPAPEPTPPPETHARLSASVRGGVLVRFPSVDPEFMFQGSLPTGIVEPAIAMGLVYAHGPGLTAWELPLVAGLRVLVKLDAWTIVPDLMLGGRVHVFGPSSFDAGGARLDFIAMAGASLLRTVGSVRLGVRLGIELSPSREHVESDQVLWARDGFGASAMLVIER